MTTSTDSARKWRRLLWDAVLETAAQLPRFSTDDVWSRVPKLSHRPAAKVLGSLLLNAKRDGHIRATPEYIKSLRPECHHRPVRVWESLLCKVPVSVPDTNHA